MIDCLGREVHVGDWVSVAKRMHNIAEHHIGKIHDIDEGERTFTVQGIDGRVTKPMNMFYHRIESEKFAKVVLLSHP